MNKEIVVKSQTDNEYSTISSNQCSWCAAEFIVKRKELLYNFINNRDKFIEIYNQCLYNGSIKRRDYKDKLYGENIDNKNLLSKYTIDIISQHTIIMNNDSNFLEILPGELRDEFYTNKYTEITIQEFKEYQDNLSCLISRHGQSFAIIPILQRYLVLDSHIHKAKIMTKEKLSHYLFNENCGHTFITIIKCL